MLNFLYAEKSQSSHLFTTGLQRNKLAASSTESKR